MARRLAMIILVLLLAPYVLAIVYRFIDPSSTLMLWRHIKGQQVTRTYVPLERISPALVRAVITSEDASFCRNYGIDVGAIREAWQQGSKRPTGARGASTITQQLAKNLFLWQDRSWLRKGLEAPLAIWVSLTWPKRRIIEVYLNVAEWGESVFGIEAAAERAFNQTAARLDQRQAALLATALPNPLKRDPARPTVLHRRLADQLAIRLQRGGADVNCLQEAKGRG